MDNKLPLKNNFNKILPYLAALIIFVALTVVYLLPAMQGKVLVQEDVSSWKGMSHEITEWCEENPEDNVCWTNSMFGGMPGYQILTKAPSVPLIDSIHSFFSRLTHLFMKRPWEFLIGYFIGFMIMLLAFGVNVWVSIIGAIAISLSSYFFLIIPVGHETKAFAFGYLAPIVGGFKLIFDKRRVLGMALVMLYTSAGITLHPQMSYYVFMMLGIFGIAELYIHFKEKRIKDLGISLACFLIALLVGCGCKFVNLVSTAEYAKESIRGGHSDIAGTYDDDLMTESEMNSRGVSLSYATAWSYGIDETLTFLVPNYMGAANNYDVGEDSPLYKGMIAKGVDRRQARQIAASAPVYWGDQPFTAGPVYMGAIVMLLFVLGLMVCKGPYKWAIVVATIFSILLSWGYHFMPLTKFFYLYFPLYSKFRTVSSILVVAEITIPLLGILGLNKIIKGEVDKAALFKSIRTATIITGGTALAVWAFSFIGSFIGPHDEEFMGNLPDWFHKLIILQRSQMVRSDAFRSLCFVLAGSASLWLYSKDKLKRPALLIVLGVLVLADMWPVDKRFFGDRNFQSKNPVEETFAMEPYEEAILKDDDPYFRVYNLASDTFNDARTSYRLKSIGGYHAAKLRRYQDIITYHLYCNPSNPNVINMLNTKYLIVADDNGAKRPVLNPNALGNAWFIDKLSFVDDAKSESDALWVINPAHEAVSDAKFRDIAGTLLETMPDSTASIALTYYSPDVLEYKSHSSIDKVAVFSDIYYPYGWNAYIDGQKQEHFRVNYILRGLTVPSGDHDIRFEFRPDSVYKGYIVNASCKAILIIFLLWSIISGIAVLLRKNHSV